MENFKISDFARSGDSHANSALVGWMLVLTGIAVGLGLAQEFGSKTIQGEIFPEPSKAPKIPSGDLTHLLVGEVLKLLK